MRGVGGVDVSSGPQYSCSFCPDGQKQRLKALESRMVDVSDWELTREDWVM